MTMILKRIRKAALVMLILVLIPVSSFAGEIDNLLSGLAGPAAGPTELVFNMEAIRLPQFSENRAEWLNGLLKHIVFRIRTDDTVQETTIETDGQAVLGYITRTGENWCETRFSFSDQIYRTETTRNIISIITESLPEENDIDYYAKIQVLLPEFYCFFSGLPDLFPENTSESKVNIQYKGYGTAVRRYSMTLSSDILYSESMAEYLAGNEMKELRTFLSDVVLEGKQRLTLLKDAEGNLMKVNYTGKSGKREDSIRNTDVDWKCLRRENGYKDILTLKTPAVSGTDRHNISLTQEMLLNEDGTEDYQCSVDTDEVKSRVRKRVRLDISLAEKDGKITGSAKKKSTSSGINDIYEYEIETESPEAEEYQGSLEIIHELNKIEREHLRIHFIALPCEKPVWENGISVSITESDLQMIRQKAAAVFLKALTGLPEEDLQYIIADLPDGWWNQSIPITEKPEDTEKP